MKRLMRGGGVRGRGKNFVGEVEWEASIDVENFTADFIRTRVGREGLGRTLHWLVLCAPFVPRVPVGQRLRRMCRLVIKSWNILSLRNRK